MLTSSPFCDQDDVWYPQKLQRVADALQGSRGGLRCAPCPRCGCERREPEKGVPAGTDWTGCSGQELPFGVYPGLAITVRRNVLSNVDYRCRPHWGDGKSDRVGHDSWLWSVAPCFGKTAILNDRLAAYRQHQNLYGDAHLSLTSRVSTGSDCEVRGSGGMAGEDCHLSVRPCSTVGGVRGVQSCGKGARTRQPSQRVLGVPWSSGGGLSGHQRECGGEGVGSPPEKSIAGRRWEGTSRASQRTDSPSPLGLVPRRGIGAET